MNVCFYIIPIHNNLRNDNQISLKMKKKYNIGTYFIFTSLYFQEWYPPDHKKSSEVNGERATLTMVETTAKDGTLIKQMRIQVVNL